MKRKKNGKEGKRKKKKRYRCLRVDAHRCFERSEFMTSHPACRGKEVKEDALKFRFQCLSRSLFHIDTVAIVSAPSASPYTSRRLHHRVCGRTSFVIRADFSPIAPVLRPEKEHEPNRKGDRKRPQIASARSRRMLHRPVGRCSERASERTRRLRPVIIGGLLLFYGRPHALAAASFTYRDSPRMRRGRRT